MLRQQLHKTIRTTTPHPLHVCSLGTQGEGRSQPISLTFKGLFSSGGRESKQFNVFRTWILVRRNTSQVSWSPLSKERKSAWRIRQTEICSDIWLSGVTRNGNGRCMFLVSVDANKIRWATLWFRRMSMKVSTELRFDISQTEAPIQIPFVDKSCTVCCRDGFALLFTGLLIK
jgi:hypothetical protein